MLLDELEPHGLSLYAVALDDSADAARPWVAAADPQLRYPTVVDTAFVTAEGFDIINVPSTVWIDEAGIIVKPASIAPADDRFRDFTNLDSSIHHDALRRWVHDDEPPPSEKLRASTSTRTDDEQLALAERRLAAWFQHAGNDDAAARHLTRAGELAPWDWTIRRAGIALRGGDPFGQEFFDFVQEWADAGQPGY